MLHNYWKMRETYFSNFNDIKKCNQIYLEKKKKIIIIVLIILILKIKM